MRIYRSEKMSEEQNLKTKEYDKKSGCLQVKTERTETKL